MKKTINISTILMLLILNFYAIDSFATQSNISNSIIEELNNISIQTSKTTVNPNEEVTVNINFGTELDLYRFEIAYDDAIFEYVSAEGGNATDISDRIIVLSDDSAASLTARNSISVTFKAKSDIITSNPTEFMITATNLANSVSTIEYEDITVPIVKNVMVEPQYVDYSFQFEYTGEIYAEENKDIKISYSSTMGKPYARARLIAEAETPEGATVKLVGIDEYRLEHNIIQSGWGNAQGYAIGGKDVSQVLNVEGTFSKPGTYNITLKLIDRENSDKVIAEETFNILVEEMMIQGSTNTNVTNGTVGEATNIITGNTSSTATNNIANTSTPTELPKTGINLYGVIVIILVGMLGFFVYQNRRK